MKRLVYIVAIDWELAEESIKTWKYWCKQNNCDFYVYSEHTDQNMAPHWHRYLIFDKKPNYDQYLYVDADAMVRWDMPNPFDSYNDLAKMYVTKDFGSLEWISNSIEGYKKFFPDITIDWEDYFATGVLLFSKKHQKLFKSFISFFNENRDEINNMQYNTLRKGFDQTPFNYFVQQSKIPLGYLSLKYSLGHLIKKDILHNGMFMNLGWIWQFNGIPKQQLHTLMSNIWNHIKDMYKD